MGELSKHLNPIPETIQRIYDWHKQRGDAEPKRGYLGASNIGHACDRFLWYTFRDCVKRDFSGRLYRLFETGELEEPRFIKELREIGCTVHDRDPKTDEQFAVFALGGHFSGHMDACILGLPEAPKTWHVGEFKTHAAKYFAQLIKNGVTRAFPTHYAQMQCYMGLTHMKRALYLACNKNTDHLHSERIHYVAKDFQQLMDRAERIIRSNALPDRLTERSDDYRCKFCDAHDLCHGDIEEAAVPILHRNCETCCHATPELDGVYEDTEGAVWSCVRQRRDLSLSERGQGCDGHLLLPGLVWFADPVDAGDGWIEFENYADKARWRHGYGPGLWSTEELIKSPGIAVGSKAVEAVKLAFGGECERTKLIDRYNDGDSERLWDGPEGRLAEGMKSTGLGLHEYTKASYWERDPDHNPPEWQAWEYASPEGENDILVAIYYDHSVDKNHVAVIWKGKS